MKIKGFTLIEITIVIIIIGVLASIAMPMFIKNTEKSKQTEAIGILMRMYRGYKILIIDEIINPTTANYYNTIGFYIFNPDESNVIPDSTGRSDRSWKELGFDQNPNYDPQFSSSYFSYDFLKKGENSYVSAPDRMGTGFPPGSSTMDIAVAWRKTSNTKIGGMSELFPVDFNKWIYVDMNTGNITKSDYYK